MTGRLRPLRVACVLLGVAGLLAKARYEGPGDAIISAYAGNVSVSFAVYFVFAASVLGSRLGGWLPAIGALAAVEVFEIMDGFGVMANTYDVVDLVANACGVALACVADAALRAWVSRRAS